MVIQAHDGGKEFLAKAIPKIGHIYRIDRIMDYRNSPWLFDNYAMLTCLRKTYRIPALFGQLFGKSATTTHGRNLNSKACCGVTFNKNPAKRALPLGRTHAFARHLSEKIAN